MVAGFYGLSTITVQDDAASQGAASIFNFDTGIAATVSGGIATITASGASIGGGWSDTGTLIRLVDTTDNVVVGGTALAGTEKLRVVGGLTQSGGAISLTGSGAASAISSSSQNLTISTTTSGTLALSSAAASTYDAATSITIGGTSSTGVTIGRSGQVASFAGNTRFAAGGAPSAPPISYTGITNSGFYAETGSPNQHYMVSNGTVVLATSDLDVTVGVKMFHPDGSASVPSVAAFALDGDTGRHRIGSGNVGLSCDGVLTVTEGKNAWAYAQQAVTSGSPTCFSITGAAHTGLTASTENRGLTLNFSATKQFATGALVTQREVYIQAPTYSAVGGSSITTAATLAISGAPTAGTNVAITSALALHVEGGIARFTGATQLNGGATINGNLQEGSADTGISIIGNRSAGSTGAADVVLRTVATRTAGSLLSVQNNTTDRIVVAYHGGIAVTQGVASSGTAPLLVLTGGAHTTQTTTTEINSLEMNPGTISWAAGTITAQRFTYFKTPTIAFASASTCTDAATVAIQAAPAAGSNATLTRSYGLWIMAGGARIAGNIGFYDTVPVAQGTVTGSRGGATVAVLADLLTKLAATGLIVDGTTA